MKLVIPELAHVSTMMTWFDSEQAVQDWAGPHFTYPYDQERFVTGLQLDKLTSFALLTEQGKLVGFGQYYLRLGRCHLGRLVVTPCQRGQGVASTLLTQLSELGKADLAVSECSLFVLAHNDAARKA